MKLKNILVLAFLTLTLIPTIIVTLLLYKSGFDLSRESYTRNMIESINVQADYISQTIENNMISDYRFAHRNYYNLGNYENIPKAELLKPFQSYLENSEDKITVCILLDKNNVPIYTIGEKNVLDIIGPQLPPLSELSNQIIMEFNLNNDIYSTGIVTPIRDDNDVYLGSLVSIYDKSYIFKIISSYYKIANISTYICRTNGEIVNFRGIADEKSNAIVEKALVELSFTSEGIIDMRMGDVPVSGYYKKIHNSPWYLVGFVDDQLIYDFTNKFILFYVFIIIGVLIAGIILSLYFSKKVVEPINALIKVMEDYKNSLNSNELKLDNKKGYFETRYLGTKFLELMRNILLVQHNFEGIYQLYQSNSMADTNIDIDVIKQTISSNKEVFQNLINEIEFLPEDCIVSKFTKCFCEKDQILLMKMFENMRDEHLSVTSEAEIYTPYLNQKWFHTLVVPMYQDDRLSRLFIQLRDISSFRKQEFKSSEQARRDALTGLYNRIGFADSVNKALQKQGDLEVHGLLFIDMDFFKLVNDNLGHSAGDELLCSVSRTILDTIEPENGIASRFGGDEFAVFLPHTSMETINNVKETLNKRLIYPFNTDEISFVVSASIGISIWNHTAPDTLEKLLQQADAAMYQAKRELKRRTQENR